MFSFYIKDFSQVPPLQINVLLHWEAIITLTLSLTLTLTLIRPLQPTIPRPPTRPIQVCATRFLFLVVGSLPFR